MIYKDPKRPEVILEWDWKEQPDWKSVTDSLAHCSSFGSEFVIHEVETNSDAHAIVIAPKFYFKDMAQVIYNNRFVYYGTEVQS
jgi:hypothetical protein